MKWSTFFEILKYFIIYNFHQSLNLHNSFRTRCLQYWKKKFHKQHEFERSIKNQSCSFDQNYKNLIEPVCSSTPSARISSLFRLHPLILKNPCPYTQLARLVTKYTLESDERRSTWQFENHKVRPRKGCTFALGWCTYKRHLCEHTVRM